MGDTIKKYILFLFLCTGLIYIHAKKFSLGSGKSIPALQKAINNSPNNIPHTATPGTNVINMITQTFWSSPTTSITITAYDKNKKVLAGPITATSKKGPGKKITYDKTKVDHLTILPGKNYSYNAVNISKQSYPQITSPGSITFEDNKTTPTSKSISIGFWDTKSKAKSGPTLKPIERNSLCDRKQKQLEAQTGYGFTPNEHTCCMNLDPIKHPELIKQFSWFVSKKTTRNDRINFANTYVFYKFLNDMEKQAEYAMQQVQQSYENFCTSSQCKKLQGAIKSGNKSKIIAALSSKDNNQIVQILQSEGLDETASEIASAGIDGMIQVLNQLSSNTIFLIATEAMADA